MKALLDTSTRSAAMLPDHVHHSREVGVFVAGAADLHENNLPLQAVNDLTALPIVEVPRLGVAFNDPEVHRLTGRDGRGSH